MRQQEFESRVQMQVSIEEYAHIEQVYVNSDLDKDEFCKFWVKMNKSRVNAAIEEAKARKIKEDQNEKLWYIVSKYCNKSYDWKISTPAEVALNSREVKLVRLVGLQLEDCSSSKNINMMLYEIKEYLKIALR